MNARSNAAGLAALSICESLLLALSENNVLQPGQARSVLEDAATANRNAVALEPDGSLHDAAATAIELILAGGNSVRFP